MFAPALDPHPDRRRSLPPGGQIAFRAMPDGVRVRVGVWPAADPALGSVLLLNGRADFIEKYAETIWDWTGRGLGVMSLDWRGQGASDRPLPDRQKGHAARFEPWIDDLDALAAAYGAELPAPHRIVAHSMGGHLTVRHLMRGGSPGVPVVLLAPMLGLAPPPGSATLARLAAARGFGDRFALFQRPYGAWQQRPERAGLLTGDLDRFADEHWWLAQHPDWQLGGVTWAWLAAALDSIAKLDAPGALERIANPVLLLVGERERLVSPQAVATAAARLPNARFERIAGARHELLRETDGLRAQVLAKIEAFLDSGA